MEAFDIGSHVVIEFEDDRKLAGYILARSDDGAGLFLNATHKESEVRLYVNPAASADIRRQLMEKPMRRLRLSAVLNGAPLAALMARDELVDVLQGIYEGRLLEGRDDSPQFRELATPVRMYVNFGYIRYMEDTDDKIMESEVNLFDQTFESELKTLLDTEEARTKEDAKADAEADEVEKPVE